MFLRNDIAVYLECVMEKKVWDKQAHKIAWKRYIETFKHAK